jgi:TPR repeat protein
MNLISYIRRIVNCKFIIVCCLLLTALNINTALARISVDKEGMNCVHQSIKNKQYKKACELLCNMANHNCVYSQCLLGLMYQRGLGVEKDINKAIDWYAKAAGRGFADAEYRLGEIYYLGQEANHEIKRDPVRAYRLLNRAALQGVARAQYYVGRMYLEGDGVPRELRKARRWLHIAADNGIDDAKRLLSQSELAEESIYNAKKLGVKIQEHVQSSSRLYNQTLVNTQYSWKGYADIVNAMNEATAAASK